MEEIREKFMEYINDENKDEAVIFYKSLLESKKHSVIDLYFLLFKPTMILIDQLQKEEKFSVWAEHVRSNIIRSLISMSYPYLVEERKRNSIQQKGKIVLICPEQEFHEIGALMIADVFYLAGWDVTYVGANTPRTEFLLAVGELEPDYIALSVTNTYNLVHAKRTIDLINKNLSQKIPIIVGGQAFQNDDEIVKEVGGDILLDSISDIMNFKGLIEDEVSA